MFDKPNFGSFSGKFERKPQNGPVTSAAFSLPAHRDRNVARIERCTLKKERDRRGDNSPEADCLPSAHHGVRTKPGDDSLTDDSSRSRATASPGPRSPTSHESGYEPGRETTPSAPNTVGTAISPAISPAAPACNRSPNSAASRANSGLISTAVPGFTRTPALRNQSE